jgi:phosphatidylglycerol---prolipoprotein diacylglyceryl transferase
VIVADALKIGIDPLAWIILPRIELGPLAVSPHGIGIALGYLLGAQAMVRRARRVGGPDESLLWNALFWALFGAIAGARIGYVLGHISEVTDGGRDPLGVLKVYEGGISLLGGITGGILASVPYIRRHRMGFWRCLDMAMVGLALGIFVGRFGDLVIGDHLGKPTTFALGWRCLGEFGGVDPVAADVYRRLAAEGVPPSLGCYDVTVHQTALYDLLSTALLLGFVVWLGRRRLNTGAMALVFGAWYGSVRVITDFLRVDRRYLGLTGSQILALIVVLAAGFLLVRYRGVPPRWASPADGERGPPTESSDEGAISR